LVIEHDNRTAITVAHKGFIHEPKVVPHKAVDSNIEGARSSEERIEKSNNNSLGIKMGVMMIAANVVIQYRIVKAHFIQ
jgi:hypothetical protein